MHIIIQSITINVIVTVKQASDEVIARPNHVVVCEYCGWTKGYSDEKGAKRGLSVHIGRHCTGKPPQSEIAQHLRKLTGK